MKLIHGEAGISEFCVTHFDCFPSIRVFIFVSKAEFIGSNVHNSSFYNGTFINCRSIRIFQAQIGILFIRTTIPSLLIENSRFPIISVYTCSHRQWYRLRIPPHPTPLQRSFGPAVWRDLSFAFGRKRQPRWPGLQSLRWRQSRHLPGPTIADCVFCFWQGWSALVSKPDSQGLCQEREPPGQLSKTIGTLAPWTRPTIGWQLLRWKRRTTKRKSRSKP